MTTQTSQSYLEVPGTELGTEHLRADGTPWRFVLVGKESTFFADEAKYVIDKLIPGYRDADDDEALLTRWRSAVVTASEVQALLAADRAHEGTFDPADETEDTLSALFGDKAIAVESFETWEHAYVPLVLVATDYEPFTRRTPIGGNVLWVDPSDEVAFLNSLANLGVFEFYTHDSE